MSSLTVLSTPPDKLSEALDKGLKRLSTDYVDAFFTHGISEFSQITGVRDWAEQMKKTGKIRLFGFSTHTNMEDCLLAAATSGWIDSIHRRHLFANAQPGLSVGQRGRSPRSDGALKNRSRLAIADLMAEASRLLA
jgi:predicted aldo/keto reductase-like oxidoreductase